MKRKAFKVILVVTVGVVCFSPCCRKAPPLLKQCDWYHPIEHIPQTEWRALSPDRYAWVLLDKRTAAVSFLTKDQSHELSISELRRLIDSVGSPEAEDIKPFVVRGVCFEKEPTFAVVRLSSDGKILHVHQGTAEAELWLPSYGQEIQVSQNPIIVWLERQPEVVYSTADEGGDRVFRGWIGVYAVKWWSSE